MEAPLNLIKYKVYKSDAYFGIARLAFREGQKEFRQCPNEAGITKLPSQITFVLTIGTCDHHPSCHLGTVLYDSERQRAIIF